MSGKAPFAVLMEPQATLVEVLKAVLDYELDVRRTSIEWDAERGRLVLTEAVED